MGIVHSLELINPKIFEELFDIFNNMSKYEKQKIKGLYEKYDKEIDVDFDLTFDEHINEKNCKIEDLVLMCFEELVTHKSYYIDKSFKTIQYIIKTIPEMDSLKFLANYDNFDVMIPNKFKSAEANFIGIWSWKIFLGTKEELNFFSNKKQVELYLKKKPYQFINKFWGVDKEIDKALSCLLEDYVWNNFITIKTAIFTAIEKKYYIAISSDM